MQLHSSIAPVALAASVCAGCLTFSVMHDSGMDAKSALVAAQWVTGIVNLGLGVPKNVLLGDFVSLLFVRPASFAAATYWLVPMLSQVTDGK